MDFMAIIGWFQNKENIEMILAGLGGFYTFAFVIVKLTPTPVDDEWLSKAQGFIHGLFGKFGVKK